jgi:RNA polymerase sigma-70 factor (ECF subfamily)
VESPTHELIERDLAALHEAGRLREVAERAMEAYAPDLLGLLVSMHGESDGAELSAQLWEDVWRGLPKFERRAAFRTWLYTLARHVAHRWQRGELRRRRQQIEADPEGGALAALEAKVRDRTLPFLRTEEKDAWRRLRDELPPDDQWLLVLRVDRGLDWNELARVHGEEDDLTRATARLRKRFQLVKDRLREMGRERGLLDDAG